MPLLDAAATDAELPVEEVAARLGLPAGMLIRRIEAGDIPARRDVRSGTPRYHLRLSDLGITAEEAAVFQGNQEAVIARTLEPAVDLTGHPSRGDAAAGEAGGTPDVEHVPPPPSLRSDDLSTFEYPGGPRAELASMTIDPRELVAGLLDRWERTLEQRIHAEHRQRFEAALNDRQHRVKELQVELQAARAEHAAAQAEKDLVLAGKERELADRERSLAEERSKRKRWGWLSRF